MSFARHVRRNTRSAPAPAAGFEAMLSGFSASPLLSDLAKTMRATVTEYKSTSEQVDRIGRDATLTDGAKLVRQATVVRSKMDAALASLGSAKAKIESGRKNVEAALHKHLDFSGANLAEISLAAETRGYARSLPDDKRAKFIQDAANGYDLPAMKAIAGAPSFLSGIHDAEHGMIRDRLLSTLAPEHVATRATLVEGEQLAESLHRQLSDSTANLVDFESADTIAKNSSSS
jgi:hypothetical protein